MLWAEGVAAGPKTLVRRSMENAQRAYFVFRNPADGGFCLPKYQEECVDEI